MGRYKEMLKEIGKGGQRLRKRQKHIRSRKSNNDDIKTIDTK